jgi:hypothetical protein
MLFSEDMIQARVKYLPDMFVSAPASNFKLICEY